MKNEDRILDATLLVVKEQTISGTRMHLIADKAGMLQSNLHYYYKTKNDLLNALQDKVLEQCLDLRKKLRKDSEDTLESQLDVFIKQKQAFILEYPEYDYAEIDFWGQGRIDQKMGHSFSKSFDGWRQEVGVILDKYVPTLDKNVRKMLPFHIISFLEGATIQYLIEEEKFDLEEYFESGKKMFLTTIYHNLEK